MGLLAVVVASVTFTVPGSTQPREQDDIDRRLAEIERARQELDRREGRVRSDISDARSRTNMLTMELQELQAVASEVQGRAAAAGAALARLEARVREKDTELKQTEESLERQLAGLGARAAHMYKQGPVSFFELVLGVEGFGDLVQRLAYARHIASDDNRRIAEINRMKAEIIRERDEIAKLRDDAARQAAVVNLERARAVSVVRAADSRRAEVSGELQASVRELGDIQRQKEQYERETARLRAESAAIAAFLRGRGDTPAQVSPKGMVWPVSGPVTSGYGWRTHPIFGTRRFHAGIDIGAPTGTPIVAAGTGTVIFSGPREGYGNTVIIDHGGGVATLYAHQSSIGAGNGAAVARGQRIGAVGCTGYCTGPHLHFEVRVNGDPVNPMGWLP